MHVLKLFLGKCIFLQFFLKFQIFSVKRPDGSLLRLDGCGSGKGYHGSPRLDGISDASEWLPYRF
jgi:hypothetical protein